MTVQQRDAEADGRAEWIAAGSPESDEDSIPADVRAMVGAKGPTMQTKDLSTIASGSGPATAIKPPSYINCGLCGMHGNLVTLNERHWCPDCVTERAAMEARGITGRALVTEWAKRRDERTAEVRAKVRAAYAKKVAA